MAEPNPDQLVVIALVSRGLTYGAIARALVISTGAAKSRVSRAAKLVGAKSTTHLVALCMSRQLIPLLREDSTPMTAPDPQTKRELLEQAARVVIGTQFGSTSMVQRELRCGYATAAELMDELQRYGVVGLAEGTRARDVLVARDELDTVVDQIRGVA